MISHDANAWISSPRRTSNIVIRISPHTRREEKQFIVFRHHSRQINHRMIRWSFLRNNKSNSIESDPNNERISFSFVSSYFLMSKQSFLFFALSSKVTIILKLILSNQLESFIESCCHTNLPNNLLSIFLTFQGWNSSIEKNKKIDFLIRTKKDIHVPLGCGLAIAPSSLVLLFCACINNT